MPENQLEKWTRVQGLCAISLALFAALGVPPAWYLAYTAWKAGTPAGASTMDTTHFTAVLYFLLGFDILFLIGGIALWVAWRKRKSTEAKAIEETVERLLVTKGIQPGPFNELTNAEPPKDSAKTAQPAPVFDGEVYRVVTSSKHAFADLTRQVIESMHREFAVDVDVLVELYLVNASSEKQYIRDFQVSVEIDGKRTALIWQNNFDAYEVNDANYVYCLDPTPDEPHLLLESRAEPLSPVFTSMPIELAPRQPLRGWAHYLLRDVDPKKLEENQTYAFVVVDSLGTEYPITRAAKLQTSSRLNIRRK
jgi:hypothetical protein